MSDNSNSGVQRDLQPDLTLYLDCDPDVGRSRIASRELDRMEQEQLVFFSSCAPGLSGPGGFVVANAYH